MERKVRSKKLKRNVNQCPCKIIFKKKIPFNALFLIKVCESRILNNLNNDTYKYPLSKSKTKNNTVIGMLSVEKHA